MCNRLSNGVWHAQFQVQKGLHANACTFTTIIKKIYDAPTSRSHNFSHQPLITQTWCHWKDDFIKFPMVTYFLYFNALRS